MIGASAERVGPSFPTPSTGRYASSPGYALDGRPALLRSLHSETAGGQSVGGPAHRRGQRAPPAFPSTARAQGGLGVSAPPNMQWVAGPEPRTDTGAALRDQPSSSRLATSDAPPRRLFQERREPAPQRTTGRQVVAQCFHPGGGRGMPAPSSQLCQLPRRQRQLRPEGDLPSSGGRSPTPAVRTSVVALAGLGLRAASAARSTAEAQRSLSPRPPSSTSSASRMPSSWSALGRRLSSAKPRARRLHRIHRIIASTASGRRTARALTPSRTGRPVSFLAKLLHTSRGRADVLTNGHERARAHCLRYLRTYGVAAPQRERYRREAVRKPL